MGRHRFERRSFIDRIRLSEFFALICTAFMLLTLFLISSTNDVTLPTQPMNAGFGKTAPVVSPLTDDEFIDEESERLPSRSIDTATPEF